ncbi:hypothetical protein PAXINDRAFT_121025 [Paxillus involutus ATCC 200175]|uniref:NACHT domain-containing protein n=1 Tax=Paxillus involutus ATCC 200175 TaxID=664439 RepID=A0A0C9TJA3_PAXIN|nr:hypothetical protein PAXINDRAFT_121025 [Paxillus involutus ATCC 200175]
MTHRRLDPRLQGLKEVPWDALLKALEFTKEVSGAFPPLRSAVGGLLVVLQAIKTAASNQNDIQELTNYVTQLNDMFKTSIPSELDACPKALQDRVETLRGKLNGIRDSIQRTDFWIIRILSADRRNSEIQGHLKNLTWAINNFIIGANISIELGVDKLHEQLGLQSGKLDVLNDQVAGVMGQMSELVGHAQSAERLPRYAITARYDQSNHRVSCADKTRTEVLSAVYQWIMLDDSLPHPGPIPLVSNSQNTSCRVFWINGLAGSGKSTIAQTVAEWCNEEKYLGASFFCSRDSAQCSNLNMVFPTIARQLAQYNSNFKKQLINAMNADKDIQSTAVSRQLEHLIVDPLEKSFGSSEAGPCVVIVDALDECRDDEEISVIIASLARYIQKLKPLKFLITSRPVHNIVGGFRAASLATSTHELVLHDIPTEKDIRVYLGEKLTAIAEAYPIPQPWPSGSETDTLVQKADGLFIFAATAVKFIGDSAGGENPKNRISLLCSETLGTVYSPYTCLGALYFQVLRSAFPAVPRQLRAKLKMILGTLALSRSQLSVVALDALMDLPPGTTKDTLRRLHSVIIVPDSDHKPIHLIHPSFHDFLIDPLRCTDSNFSVNSTVQHTVIAKQCLFTLTKLLHRDMCNIGDSSKLNIEIPNLSERIQLCIPLSLQYACRHWTFHVCNSHGIDDELFKHLEDFCGKNMLHWLEVSSLLGELDGAVECLRAVRHFLMKLPLPQSDVPALLEDCERIVMQCLPGLRASCVQAYCGLVPFCPKQTCFRRLYGDQALTTVAVLSGLDETWSSCIQVMEGHTDWVQDVAFSADNRNIASASNDHSIRIWSGNGAHLHTLQGHSGWVTSVVFCDPLKQVFSGSYDSCIKVWDMMTGACVHTWNVQAKVEALACSRSGDLVAAAFDDGLISIWDTRPRCRDSPPILFEDNPTRSIVKAIQFLHDGTRLLSGGGDGCKLWDIRTPQCQQTYPHDIGVSSVAVAPGDLMIACGGGDNTITLWQTADASRSRVLHAHGGTALRLPLDFSPDATILASATSVIQLWDVDTGSGNSANQTVARHQLGSVTALAFSGNGSMLASGSGGSISLWNGVTGKHLRTSTFGHGSINSISFSPNSKQVAVSTKDDTVRIVDTETANNVFVLKEHCKSVAQVAFASQEDQQLVCCGSLGSDQGTICLWDLKANPPQHQFLFRRVRIINTIAVSPKADLVAFGWRHSNDGSITLLDVRTRTILWKFDPNDINVVSLSFSRDGTRLLSGATTGHIALWNVAIASNGRSGEEALISSFQAESKIQYVSFSRDEKSIVSDASCHDMSHLPSSAGHTRTPEQRSVEHFLLDDWLWRGIPDRRRLCWIPAAFRHARWGGREYLGRMAGFQNIIAFGTASGRLVVIDASNCE